MTSSSALRRHASLLLSALLIISLQLAKAQNDERQCFLPNGALSGDKPCDPTADHSMCCFSPDHCLSNGLCIDPAVRTKGTDGPSKGNMYSRGTCTDKTFKSPFCPQQCTLNLDETHTPYKNWTAEGVMVWGCNKQGYGQPAAYCCESVAVEQECCSTGTFSLQGATIGAALAVQTFTTSSPATSQPTAASSGPSSSVISTITTTRPDGSVATIPVFSNSDTTTPPPPENLAAASPSGLSDSAKIGIGIGVGLGAALIIIGGLFLYFYRRSHPPVPSSNPPSSPTHGGMSPYGGQGPETSSIHHAESVTSGGTFVNGRYIYTGSSKRDEFSTKTGGVNSVTELDSARKSMSELDNGQGLPSEMSTWEHSPAELEGPGAGWGSFHREEFDQSPTMGQQGVGRRSYRPSGGNGGVI
ncbi:hypothetical protein QBC35DRAFT_395680 [Podospora australis]|uniref:Mid2 domain-containing protein n=1 Tax=Podospora australis TaxID=1536484 RepID=A0AAN7AE73_9PEZI|nr:hypothetical protein QBC35DRAFT_395680 [Podospora australis]